MDRTLSLVCILTVMSAQAQYNFYHQRRSEAAYPPLTNVNKNPQSTNLHYTNPPVYNPPTKHPEARTNRIQRQDTSIDEVSRVENGSYKILNRPEISKRGAIEDSDNDKVVFPGPTSNTRRSIVLDIPEKCKKLGYCEDVPNHPVLLVENAINKIGDGVKYLQKDVLPDAVSVTQRLGEDDVETQLCSAHLTVLKPQALPDKDGYWHTVVNLKNKPVQSFLVELCNEAELPCKLVAFGDGRTTSACVQKHVTRYITGLDENGAVAQLPLKLPSCCVCVARPKLP